MERSSLTLDLGASDPLHASASRAAALTYASVIETEKPELAKRIRDAALECELPSDDTEHGVKILSDMERTFKCPHHGILEHSDIMNLHDNVYCGKCYQELFKDKEQISKILVKVEIL